MGISYQDKSNTAKTGTQYRVFLNILAPTFLNEARQKNVENYFLFKDKTAIASSVITIPELV
jgi:hypothetical protein